MGKERLPPIKVPEYSEAWTQRSRNTHQRSRRKTEPCPRWLKIVNWNVRLEGGPTTGICSFGCKCAVRRERGRSCLQHRLYQMTRNQWAQRSGLIELDLLNSACPRGREVAGIGRKMMKTKENKQNKPQAAVLWFCCNPSPIELCFSPLTMQTRKTTHTRKGKHQE